MSSSGTYIFSKANCGSLELVVDTPSKKVYGQPNPETVPFRIEGLTEHISNPSGPIYFFEWQKIHYSYYINLSESNTLKGPFKLRIHEGVEKESTERERGVHLLSGVFSFSDQVGETTLEIIDANGNSVFKLDTEVFPQKMDYKSDYKAMMEEISSIIENLAFDSLKDTFRRSKARLSGHATQNEWWNILDALFNQLVINLGVIKRQPKHEIKTRENVCHIDKIKHTSKHNVDWLRKNRQYVNQDGNGIQFTDTHSVTHALSSKKYVTYDTYENRFIVWAIKNIIEQLRQYKRYTENAQSQKDYSLLTTRMKTYQSKLQGILHESPFNEVGQFEKRSYFSTSLTRGTGYRDFMHIYLLLARGLEIANNDIFKIEQKDISTLYEYWCFLKLVQLLKEQNTSEIDYRDLIQINSNKFQVNLRKGTQSKVTFNKQETGDRTTIYFNREFDTKSGKSFTYNQKPDYTLEFRKNGYRHPFWYLFDAKYRFDEQSENDNNTYNVPQDAIGQLHRYRDAILHSQSTNTSYRGAIKNLGGIILYPYPLSEKEFEKNTYYKSIDDVNIGAMPFLPSKSTLVSTFLNNLINKSPDEHFEDFIEMDRSEYERHRNLWNEWVTIGVIPTSSQAARKKFLEDKLIYHVPFVKNSNSKLFNSKKILVCIAGKRDAILYDVVEWEIMDKSELKDIGTTWDHRNEKYVAFHLKLDQICVTPDSLSPMSYRYATFEGLNRYLSDPTKDRKLFYLTSPDAARLYDELKKKNIPFEVDWVKNDADPSLIEFMIGTHRVLSSTNFDFLTFKSKGSFIPLKELLSIV